MANGFALVELLMTLCIIAIISVIGITTLSVFREDTNAHVLMAQLVRAIQLTRIEAMTSHKKMILCRSRDQKTCSGDWLDGFIVKMKTGDQVSYVFNNFSRQGILHWRAFPANRQLLEFLPTGLLQTGNGTFWFCSNGKVDPHWAIILNKSGRVRSMYPNREGHVVDAKGLVLKC